MTLPDDLAERAAYLRISPERLRHLLTCGSDTPDGRWVNKPPRKRSINHHIRKHPRMKAYYVVIRRNEQTVRLYGGMTKTAARKVRDDYLAEHP